MQLADSVSNETITDDLASFMVHNEPIRNNYSKLLYFGRVSGLLTCLRNLGVTTENSNAG